MKFLLTLLLGAFIGWMIRHRRWRHEMTHFRRAQLRDSVGGRTSLDRSDGSLQGSGTDSAEYLVDNYQTSSAESVTASTAGAKSGAVPIGPGVVDPAEYALGMERLQAALDEKTAQHDKLQGLLFDLHEKEEVLQVKNDEVNALAVELSAAQTRIATLESKLIDAEDAIDASRNRSEYISELEKRLENFESGVQIDRAPAGKVAELERDIEAKNREIVRLAQEVDEVSNQQQAATADNAETTAAVATATVAASAAARQLASAQSVLREKDQEVLRLKAEQQGLLDERRQYQEAQRTIKQQAVQIEGGRNLSARLAEKEKAVSQLQQQVAQLEELQTKADDLKSKLAVADADASKLADSQSEIAGLKGQLQKTSINQSELVEKNQTIAQLRQQLENSRQLKSQLEQGNKELQTLRAQAKQSVSLESSLQEKEAELQRLRKMATELEQSQQRIESLSQSLSEAEKDVGQAKQNDLELRRLRSECQILQHERSTAAEKISTLEGRLQQLKLSAEPVAGAAGQGRANTQDLMRLEADLARRDSQIAELKQRLASLPANTGSGHSRAGAFGGGISGGGASQAESAAGRVADEQGKAAAGEAARGKAESASKDVQRAKVVALFKTQEQSDNLKLISGIGPVMEQLLNELGVTTFKQLAAFSKADIDMVSDAIDVFPGRIERDNWVGGAREQYAKKYGVEIEA